MRGGVFALSGLVVLIVASFANPALAEEAVDGESPYAKEPYGDAAAASDECARMGEAARQRIQSYLEGQRADYEAFVAHQEADHKAFHERNVSEADEKAFHERQAAAYAAFKGELSSQLDRVTVEAWQAYREHCEQRPSASTPSDAPAECREKWSELERMMEEARRKWEARHKEFQAQYDAARADFKAGNHSDSDWKAFEEKWHAEARALYSAMEADMKAAAERAGLLRCWLLFHERADKPVPSYTAKDGRDVHMDEGAKRVMERCQARINQLMAEYKGANTASATRSDYQATNNGTMVSPSKSAEPVVYPARSTEPVVYPSKSPYPAATQSSASDAEFRERMMKLKAECEAEMKAYLEKKHADKRGDFGSFVVREEDGRILVQGKYLSMVALPERQTLTEIAVNKKLLVDALYANGYLAEFQPEQSEEGSSIAVFDASGKKILQVHDNPRGVMKFATSADIESITLDLHDALKLSEDREGIRFAYGEWKGAVLVHRGSVEIGEGNVLTLQGKATFVVTNAFREKERLGDKYQDAVLNKKVGAEINVAKDGTADATPLTDLEVNDMRLEGGKLTAKFDAPDGEGKTVVFKVESGLFKCDGLRVKLYSVAKDGSESTLEIREADDLEDVLDPEDDGANGFEYWCVTDKDGQQVLVSIAHFSEKRVEIESAATDLIGLVPGFGASLVLAAAGLSLVAFGARRRK